MIKFAFTNKNGIFDLDRSAAFLAETKDTIIELMNVFEESQIIKTSQKSMKDYKIEFVDNTEISKTLHTNSYKNFLDK